MNTCPEGEDFDKEECLITKNGQSFGCATDEFCMYTEDTDVTNEEHFNTFICVGKREANEDCDKSEQCLTGMCSTYPSRQNFCYQCIGDKNQSSETYGKERTKSHCNVDTQYCALENTVDDNGVSDNTENTC